MKVNSPVPAASRLLWWSVAGAVLLIIASAMWTWLKPRPVSAVPAQAPKVVAAPGVPVSSYTGESVTRSLQESGQVAPAIESKITSWEEVAERRRIQDEERRLRLREQERRRQAEEARKAAEVKVQQQETPALIEESQLQEMPIAQESAAQQNQEEVSQQNSHSFSSESVHHLPDSLLESESHPTKLPEIITAPANVGANVETESEHTEKSALVEPLEPVIP